jgi:hypothetical protein
LKVVSFARGLAYFAVPKVGVAERGVVHGNGLIDQYFVSYLSTTIPPTKNTLSSHFTKRPSIDRGKCPIPVLACKHCKWTGTNTKRAIEHFTEDDCPSSPFKEKDLSKRPAKRQQTLQFGIATLSRSKKQKLDSAAALAIYMGARPFSLWDDPYIKAFLDLLGDNLYTTPNRRLIGGDLLEKAYQELLDESTDIAHQRILNLSMVLPSYGSFYLENENVGDKALNVLD